MNLFFQLAARAILLVMCGAVIVAAVRLSMPDPPDFRPWPHCLVIAGGAAVCISALAAVMMAIA
jgi:hypothetical protein